MSALHLHVTLHPRGPAAAVILTDEQATTFNAGKAFPVTVTIGQTSVQGRCCRMGGENLIGLSKAARAHLGVEIGQEVDVTVALDTEERTVELPPELASALSSDPSARKAFDGLSYTRRKELAAGIAVAKKPETRARRLAAAMAELSQQ